MGAPTHEQNCCTMCHLPHHVGAEWKQFWIAPSGPDPKAGKKNKLRAPCGQTGPDRRLSDWATRWKSLVAICTSCRCMFFLFTRTIPTCPKSRAIFRFSRRRSIPCFLGGGFLLQQALKIRNIQWFPTVGAGLYHGLWGVGLSLGVDLPKRKNYMIWIVWLYHGLWGVAFPWHLALTCHKLKRALNDFLPPICYWKREGKARFSSKFVWM